MRKMNIVGWALSVPVRSFSVWRSRSIVLLLAVFSLGHASSVFAVDPPQNIRIEGNVILWDEVENAVNYNVYFLEGPVVDTTQSPRYVDTVNFGLEFNLNPTTDGFYTVVTVAVGDNGLEFSDVADGIVVPFSGSNENSTTVTVNNILEIRSVRCDNVVAGGSCQSQCPLAIGVRNIPTGGACRADAGVVLHQRALNDGFACISQNDTSFVEVDVYCLDVSRF